MKMQTANVNTIPCRDCLYRDKTTIKVDGEIIRVGITRDTCMIFDGKNGNWKPSNVYFQSKRCPLYEWDETAEKYLEGEKMIIQ